MFDAFTHRKEYNQLLSLENVPNKVLKRAFSNLSETVNAYKINTFSTDQSEAAISDMINGLLKPVVTYISDMPGDNILKQCSQASLSINPKVTRHPDYSVAIMAEFAWLQFLSVECRLKVAADGEFQSVIHLLGMSLQANFNENKVNCVCQFEF